MLLSLYSVIVDMEVKRRVCNYGENIHPVVVIVLTQLYVNFTVCFYSLHLVLPLRLYKVLQLKDNDFLFTDN